MPGKVEEWSWEEIRTVILYLDAMGFQDEEICRGIWEVYGFNSISKKQVYRILAADKLAKLPVAGRADPFGVPPTEDDIEISYFLELYSENILNYPVQSSKYHWNQWNLNRKEPCNREHYSRTQHHALHFEKTANIQNSAELKNKVLHEKLQDIFDSFSPQNFSVTAFEIKNLGIVTEGSLNEVIDTVFEKAVEKPDFSIPYANFCKLLSLLKVPYTEQEGQLVDIGELLLSKCLKELEKNEVNQLNREEINKTVQDDKEKLLNIAEEKQKSRRQLGTVRFMGWLFKLDIFTEFVMHQTIENLLLHDDEVGAKCVCLLITAIGNDLNTDKIENYISNLRKIIDKQCASAKLEIILQHISDLKMNNWVSCTEEKCLELINEVFSEDPGETQKQELLPLEHSDSESDDKEQQEDNSSTSDPQRKKYDREFLLNLRFHPLCKQKPANLPDLLIIKDEDNWGQRHDKNSPKKRMYKGARGEPCDVKTVSGNCDNWRNPRPPMSENGWNMSGKSSKRNHTVDPMKLKLTKPAEVESMQLGPGRGFSSWAKGGSDGAKSSSIEEGFKTAALQNYRSAASSHKSSRGCNNQLPSLATWKTPSISEEYDIVIGAVKTFTRTKLPEFKRPQEAQTVSDKNITVLKGNELSSEDIEKKTKPLIDEFLQNSDLEKLEFTTKEIGEPKLRKQITPEEIKQNLPKLLRDCKSNEEVFNWLERHIEGEMSPPMYRALVTAVYESVITCSGTNCELNVSKLKERMCILTRYMDVQRNLELHAIFALQYLMNKLDHPKGILQQIFDLAYNEDFLSGDAFKQWEHCDDPAEQEGKGIAIQSVSSLFAWLKEGEDDESVESD